ncbi:aspartyl protease family protein [Candidatus Poriferisodalis sp.]|uniref:aspartyl protease family protein n=1 Tax=Candidatus Poriferisodalis sp. TaxID=3101277 RepID=UPI003B011DF2
MPSFDGKVRSNRILLIVRVALPDSSDPIHACHALVDTGASSTVISPAVTTALNAVSIGVRTVGTASQPSVAADQYVLDIHIPVETSHSGPDGEPVKGSYVHKQRVTAVQLPIGDGTYDVLLGMDVFSQHHISMHSGQFHMSV